MTYSLNGASKWISVPMSMAAPEGDVWFRRVEVSAGIEFAFTDGGDEWDNNNLKNYSVCLPGKYGIESNRILYLGPSSADKHLV